MLKVLLSSLFICAGLFTFGQQPMALQLEQRGEVVVSFEAGFLNELPNLGSWSVDKVKNGKAYVYLNTRQYEQLLELQIPFIPEPIPSLISEVAMAHSVAEAAAWDTYPDYDTYVAMMEQFALDYPDLCQLDTIGYTTDSRMLLALKISDKVAIDEPEPEVFYSSSMHGDELTGYVLMLRLADYLLVNYNDPQIKNLVDNLEIYINPLANPDGTFKAGNTSVNGATRSNAKSVDINRNFPDPLGSDHPDGMPWQAETLAMMDFMQQRNFGLSMNFHGGAEVLNYPWDDTLPGGPYLHPDNAWFDFICRSYADTVHLIDANYMSDLDNGVTIGYKWYAISGGRQDYVTHFLHGREITAELSSIKLISASLLPAHWDKNYRSLLGFLEQALYGVHGLVTDADGNALAAKIAVLNYDADSSFVRTQKGGVFFRYLKSGSYTLEVSADGYITKTIPSLSLTDFEALNLHVVLEKVTSLITEQDVNPEIFPNPASDNLFIRFPKDRMVDKIELLTLDGKVIQSPWSRQGENILLNLGHVTPGIYLLVMHFQGEISSQRLLKK